MRSILILKTNYCICSIFMMVANMSILNYNMSTTTSKRSKHDGFFFVVHKDFGEKFRSDSTNKAVYRTQLQRSEGFDESRL